MHERRWCSDMTSADLHALSTRIDQLERVVLTQAKEIEALKRAVGSHPSTAVQLSKPLAAATRYSALVMPVSQTRPTQSHLSGLAAPSENIKPALQQQQQQQPQHYPMNPLVHPPSAIPPVTSRPSKFAANSERLVSSSSCYGNGLVPTNRVPPVARWSVGPDQLSQAEWRDEQDQDDAATSKRLGRQSCVEVLTCFCPCFSMC